jgi:hypothetical protein
VPRIGGEEFLRMMSVYEQLGKEPFTSEPDHPLKSMADKAPTHLLNTDMLNIS